MSETNLESQLSESLRLVGDGVGASDMNHATKLWTAAKHAAEALGAAGSYPRLLLDAGAPVGLVRAFAAASGANIMRVVYFTHREPPYVIEAASVRHAGLDIAIQGSRPVRYGDAQYPGHDSDACRSMASHEVAARLATHFKVELVQPDGPGAA